MLLDEQELDLDQEDGMNSPEDKTRTAAAAFDFSEVVIHQMIETIEFALGTVSHTASYLRLWALSLAHQQLSLVFFQFLLLPALTSGSAVAIVLGFGLWFGVTAAILMFMDVLECFLHTLRLHWVEFQSKYFRADGVLFSPFQHARVLEMVA